MDDDELLSNSIFGTATPNSVSEFAADVNPSLSSSFLADNFTIGNPWDPPTVLNVNDTSNILANVDLPDIYAYAFNLAQPMGGRIPVSALHKILTVSGQPHATVEKILNLAVPASNTRVNRGEFNTALALVGLAQKHMDVSIETLLARKDDLPEPILPNLESINFNNRASSFGNLSQPIITQPNTAPPLEADPWAMPSQSTSNGVPTFTISDITTDFPSQSSSVPRVQPDGRSGGGLLAREEEFRWCDDTDPITVKFAPEREGFLFKHVNYIIESQRHGSTVTRRYSDFWWLMECLVRKYPYRILPALPPKKIGVNGFYFTVDESFLEKRRKGLIRFLNFIARHPVLRDEELVKIFLTEQQEIALWRKTNTPDLEEEFLKKTVPEEIEVRIPADLEERLNKVNKKLNESIEHYRNMCHIMERIARRREGLSSDYTRYGAALNSLIDIEKKCYIENCSNCTRIANGLTDVSSHIQRASAIIEEEETFERRDRLAMDNTIDALETRISTNTAKLSGKEDPETERLSAVIQKDRVDVDLQRKRKIFIRHCFNAELSLFHKSSAFISLLYQNYAHEQVKFSQQFYENWKLLSPKIFEMPIQTIDFG
ncbi:2659_t:CDS:10 [Ambispora gerdemannii]|uniref:Sorting nexin MVP1 n=1 Tax=Ambispora gerdemannii TaxID=144530 RepID=A0A9N9A9I3_9GLOM|nr:2659_t:CDS:10 [Ambispora gerdemannii]